MIAFLLAVTVAIGEPGSTATREAPPRWYGIGFGTAAIAYRPILGDPVSIDRLPDAPGNSSERRARFWIPGAGGFLVVSERRGAVVGIETLAVTPPPRPVLSIEPDPSGIALGSSTADVAARHPSASRARDSSGRVRLVVSIDASRGLSAEYTFANDRLIADRWWTPPAWDGPPPPGGVEYGDPAADAETTAILDVQTNEHDGIAWERMYLRDRTCDGRSAWAWSSQATRMDRGRRYDVIAVTCPTTGAKRDFYFDVTAFFGKP